MASLQLKLLGGFAARLASGQAIEIAGRKNQALLAYLALSEGKEVSRDKLIGLLWSDRGEEQGRNSLRQALVALKRALSGADPLPLLIEGDQVALDPTGISCDAVKFLALAKHNSTADLRHAASLYEGQLLDGISVRDPAFEEWLSVERARLHEAATVVLCKAADQSSGTEAVAFAQRAVALDPLKEASHRSLMQAHVVNGEKASALQAYAICHDLIKKELGVEPGPAIEELRLQILRGELLSPVSARQSSTSLGSSAASVAVLPFTSMSADVEQEYLCDGIAEDIITDLSKVSALFVAARHSSFALKGKPIEISEAARKLNVRYILEGSVRKAGNRIRIAAQLIDAATGGHVWAERYDRELGDIFTLQDDISKNVVASLKVKLLPGEMEAISHRPTRSVEAYEYCLLGRSTLYGGWGDKETLRAARSLFSKAVDVDPGYARAYAGIADCDAYLWSAGDLDVSAEDILANSSRALGLAPNLAEAHASRGLALYRAGSPDEGAIALKRAIELDPDLFEAHFFYGMTRWVTGRYREAAEEFERAAELRSTDYIALNMLAAAYAGQGSHAQVEAAAKRGITRIERALTEHPDDPVTLAWGASTLVYLGANSRAGKWADRAVTSASSDYFVRYLSAGVYALIGRSKDALECLEAAYSLAPRARPVLFQWISHDDQFDGLRTDVEFKAFLTRLEAEVVKSPTQPAE